MVCGWFGVEWGNFLIGKCDVNGLSLHLVKNSVLDRFF